MRTPVKKEDGKWWVGTEDGTSGPWETKAAAEALAEGRVTEANMINNRALARNKLYKKGSK